MYAYINISKSKQYTIWKIIYELKRYVLFDRGKSNYFHTIEILWK